MKYSPPDKLTLLSGNVTEPENAAKARQLRYNLCHAWLHPRTVTQPAQQRQQAQRAQVIPRVHLVGARRRLSVPVHHARRRCSREQACAMLCNLVPAGMEQKCSLGAHACACMHTGLPAHATCKALIYLDWNNLSVAVILTTSVLRSQSGAVLIEAFMSSHKSSKMKTQGPLKYTPRVCAVQLEAFMTPVRAFMTL